MWVGVTGVHLDNMVSHDPGLLLVLVLVVFVHGFVCGVWVSL